MPGVPVIAVVEAAVEDNVDGQVEEPINQSQNPHTINDENGFFKPIKMYELQSQELAVQFQPGGGDDEVPDVPVLAVAEDVVDDVAVGQVEKPINQSQTHKQSPMKMDFFNQSISRYRLAAGLVESQRNSLSTLGGRCCGTSLTVRTQDPKRETATFTESARQALVAPSLRSTIGCIPATSEYVHL